MTTETRARLPVADLMWGAGIVVLALLGTLARRSGWIDGDTLLRLVMGPTGLMVAYYGNLAPKRLAPSHLGQRIGRIAGWSLVLSGLLYASLWAFAPVQVALGLGTGAIVAGLAVTVGYGLWLRGQSRAGT